MDVPVDGLGEPFETLQVVVYVVYLLGIDVPVAMREHVPKATDVDEFLAAPAREYAELDEFDEHLGVGRLTQVAALETAD